MKKITSKEFDRWMGKYEVEGPFSEVLASTLNNGAPINEETRQVLWFVQHMATQRDGLTRLAEDLLQSFPERIAVHGDCVDGYFSHRASLEYMRKYQALEPEGSDDKIWRWNNLDLSRISKEDEKLLSTVPLLSLDSVRAEVAKRLVSDLVKCFHLWMQEEPTEFCNLRSPIVFRNLGETLFEYLSKFADKRREQIAETSISRQVFESLDFAFEETVMVKIEGDPRIGKTESIKAWCEMHPGRARLVNVPCSNSETDFFKAIADALGIPYNLGVKRDLIKDKVEFVLKHSKLMLVFDEAHWLLPQRFSAGTPPIRMNWVRSVITDRNIPCAIVITPQSFEPTNKAFLKKTGYTFAQFAGRTAECMLPKDVPEDDLMAVARKHFPDLGHHYLELIVARAMRSKQYLKAVDHVARKARFLARKEESAKVTSKHVKRALADLLPGVREVQTGTAANDSTPLIEETCTPTPPEVDGPCNQPAKEGNRISKVKLEDTLEVLLPA